MACSVIETSRPRFFEYTMQRGPGCLLQNRGYAVMPGFLLHIGDTHS